MHDAGFDAEGAIDRERLGVYVGSGVGGMQTLVDNVHTIADRGPRRASPYMIAMMIPNMASGNIAIRHKAKGPTLPVVTACATSAHAVGGRSVLSSTAMPTRSSRAVPGGHYPRCCCRLYVLPRIDHQPRFRDGLPPVRRRPRWLCDG